MAKAILRKLIFNPLQRFVKDSRSVGNILFSCSLLSVFLANMADGKAYIEVWNFEVPFPHQLHLPHSILHWINDALMAVFFFLMGMEIKRELGSSPP